MNDKKKLITPLSSALLETQIKQMGLASSIVSRELQFSLDPFRQMMKMNAFSITAASISVPFQLQQSIFNLQDQMKSLSGIYSVTRDMRKLFPMIDIAPFKHLERITQMEIVMKSSFSSLAETMRLPSIVLKDSLASMVALIKTYELRPNLAIEVAKLPQAYARYSERQISRLVKIEDKNHPLIEVIEDTLESASTIIEDSKLLVEGIAWGDISTTNDDIDANYSTFNLFPSLNSHLAPLYAGRVSTSEFDINNTLPVVIHKLGCRLIELICNINEIQLATHGVALFTLTQKMMMGFLKIPNTISSNEMHFADIVDYLYFMLYEGSGDAKRLVGITNNNDDLLWPLWNLKHLRLNFRHDVEHGKDISKKLIQGGAAFKNLIGQHRPRTTSDWKQAQLKIYEHLGNMLTGILMRMI